VPKGLRSPLSHGRPLSAFLRDTKRRVRTNVVMRVVMKKDLVREGGHRKPLLCPVEPSDLLDMLSRPAGLHSRLQSSKVTADELTKTK